MRVQVQARAGCLLNPAAGRPQLAASAAAARLSPRVVVAQARHLDVSAAAAAEGSDVAAEGSGEFCMPAYVTVDNQKNERFTILDVEVQDYPGTREERRQRCCPLSLSSAAAGCSHCLKPQGPRLTLREEPLHNNRPQTQGVLHPSLASQGSCASSPGRSTGWT